MLKIVITKQLIKKKIPTVRTGDISLKLKQHHKIKLPSSLLVQGEQSAPSSVATQFGIVHF
jgi:hypothetical protein